jgi:hypothetical protein
MKTERVNRAGRRAVGFAALTLGIMTLLPLTSAARTVWGTSTAEMATAPGYEGYWHYTLELNWDTTEIGGHGMSHLDFFLNLGVCYCSCYPDVVRFDDVPGTGLGVNGCDLGFVGLYECRGDPHYPEEGAMVKFEHDEAGCEPDWNGTATLDFYSMFEPGEPETHTAVLGIKAGTETGKGPLEGVLPLCECGTPVEGFSWGTMKALYR